MNEQGCSLVINIRDEKMKTLIFTILLILISISAHSKNEYTEPTFCEWIGHSATSVAQNRHNGVNKYDLISDYLSKDKSYGERSIVIPLIDRVYGIKRKMRPDEVAFAEKQQCDIAFVMHAELI